MLEGAQSSVVTKFGGRSVAETVDRLERFIADRGFTLFRVIDHSGTAEGAGVQVPDSKLVMFGNPAMGYVAITAALFALGAWLGRDLAAGAGIIAFIAAFAGLIGMWFAARRSVPPWCRERSSRPVLAFKLAPPHDRQIMSPVVRCATP